VLLHKGRGGDRDVYYNKESIKKINDNIREIYISIIIAKNKNSVQQVRIDCKNKKTASGLSSVYVNGIETQSMDFSKYDWVWFAPKNNVNKKLIDLCCKQK
jgi:hypothetical protein